MGTVNHARLLIRGGYTDANLTEETWQMGINFAVSGIEPALVAESDYFFDVAADDLEDLTTDYDITSNFLFEGGVKDIDPVDWLASQIGPAVQTFFATSSLVSNIVEVRELVMYGIGSDGKVLQTDFGPARAQAIPNIEIKGVYAGGVTPLQISTVASWRTSNNTRHGRGRNYLPSTAVGALQSAGIFNPTYTGAVALACKTLLNDMKISAGAVYGYPVVCKANNTPEGKLNLITSVKVGNIPDTQRRRRRQLDETYATESL